MSNFYSIVLAAGQGTRMKSKLHKVLHQVAGKPMIGHVVSLLQSIDTEEIVVVVGHKSEDVKNYLGNQVKYVMQEQQLGTAHAVLQADAILKNKKGTTLVVMGDTPVISLDTINALLHTHQESKASATILTTELNPPTGYGRIIRDENGLVMSIVEQKDATTDQAKITEVNTGTYCFDNEKLFEALAKVDNNNTQGEFYLTDVVEILRSNNDKVMAYQTLDAQETIGINDRVALAEAEQVLQRRLVEAHMKAGVTVIDPNRTYIESDVVIAPDTIIYPNTYLKGNTVIGSECTIGPGVDFKDMQVGDGVTVTHSVALSSVIESNTIVGPYAYIRPGSNIGENVKIGDFVEIKNSSIGKGTKVPHLSYIGDATLGENINIGCGTITVNYDGVKKHRTEIGDNSFVGCNTNLVAPVSLGKDVYVAAGSTITDDIPDLSLAIARERQVNKEGYVKKIREKLQSDSN